MAYFLRLATAASRIGAAAMKPAPYTSSTRYPSAAILRRTVHKASRVPPAVHPELRSELNRIEEDCVRRDSEFAADLTKLHSRVREEYSARFNKGYPTPSFGGFWTWSVCVSILIPTVLAWFAFLLNQIQLEKVKRMWKEVEAKTERVITKKLGAGEA